MVPLSNSLQPCSAHGHLPINRADLICRARKPAAICAYTHPSIRARPTVYGYSQRWLIIIIMKILLSHWPIKTADGLLILVPHKTLHRTVIILAFTRSSHHGALESHSSAWHGQNGSGLGRAKKERKEGKCTYYYSGPPPARRGYN